MSNSLASQLDASLTAMTAVSRDVADYTCLDDATLTELARLASVERQLADTHTALIAGEIAVRSNPALGNAGLAQRNGFRTPAEMVRVTGRSTVREATESIRVGTMMRPADTDPMTGEMIPNAEPWLAAVTAALVAGSLPVASADAIRNGLGSPSSGVTVQALADAATLLCGEAATVDADRLYTLAREYRNAIDMAGVADRERECHQRRSLRFTRLPDGMSRLAWLMDPETAAVFGDLYDRATSPRRGGPRFADPTLKTQAAGMVADTRTTDQYASDVFLELLRHGADADSSQLLGSGAPVINVHVLATTLNRSAGGAKSGRSGATITTAAGTGGRTGTNTNTARTGTGAGFGIGRDGPGVGRIEGQTDPISLPTVERLTCNGIIIPIIFDATGQALDEGLGNRFYNRKQRRALAGRDGGCMIPGCDRPPSWTEAHHLVRWKDGGKTDIADGILLCRHHHLMLHNNEWNITRTGADYWLTPPTDIDPEQTPILLVSKNAIHRDMLTEVSHGDVVRPAAELVALALSP